MILLISLTLILVIWAAYIVYKYKSLEQDARDIFNAQKEYEPSYQAVGETGFVEAYKRAYSPRGHVINFVASIVAIISLPTFYFGASWIWNTIWNATGRVGDLDEGFAPWLFGISILCILGLILIAGIAGRMQHQNRPKPLEQEIQAQIEGKAQS